MTQAIPFEQETEAPIGRTETLTPLVRRLVAPNGGPFTYRGTCSYIVGRGRVAIIDPGPDDATHVAGLLDAVRGETVTHIVVTHTHRDHSPAASALRAATGALVVGCSPHVASRPLALGEANVLDASADHDYAPDVVLEDGEAVSGPQWTLQALATPGHTANHLAFALPEENTLFSGDHVMAWSTTIVAPPDGSMQAYMASLAKLRARREEVYRPGHGGPVREPQRFLRALVHHRRQREAAILNRLAAGDETIAQIVPLLYEGLAPALHGAAGLSVFAHLEDLVARGLVVCDGAPTLAARYRPA